MRILLAMMLLAGAMNIWAVELKSLPYPEDQPDARMVARQVFYVNRLFSFANLSIEDHPKGVAVVVDNVPGKKKTITAVERHINNTYQDGEIASRELSIFRSGKLKGAAILLTDYKDPGRPPRYMLRLPVINKTRVIEISDTDETWGGTVFTYEEMLPSNPDWEQHELLGVRKFKACLSSVAVPPQKKLRWIDIPDQPVCDHKGKLVYMLKSIPELHVHWYDYRISHVDTTSFANYRTEYYKDGGIIKIIDRDWHSVGLQDPRALQWHHIYGKDFVTGHETYIVVPDTAVSINTDKNESFWTEESLRTLNIP
jgi:hypothetical protein